MERAYVGIDLAANPKKCTGYAVITCGDFCMLSLARCLYGDDEIITAVYELKHCRRLVIALDAPFKISNGMRDVDRRMVSMGLKVLPPGFKHMRSLTLRAVKLVEMLNSLGIVDVYETHPRSALFNSGCGNVNELLTKLSINLRGYNLDSLSKDVRDAIIASTVSYCIDLNCCLKVEGSEGTIWLLDRVCKT